MYCSVELINIISIKTTFIDLNLVTNFNSLRWINFFNVCRRTSVVENTATRSRKWCLSEEDSRSSKLICNTWDLKNIIQIDEDVIGNIQITSIRNSQGENLLNTINICTQSKLLLESVELIFNAVESNELTRIESKELVGLNFSDLELELFKLSEGCYARVCSIEVWNRIDSCSYCVLSGTINLGNQEVQCSIGTIFGIS